VVLIEDDDIDERLENVVSELAVVTLLADDSLDALLPLLMVVALLLEDVQVDVVVVVLVKDDMLLFEDALLPLVRVELVVPVVPVEDDE